MAAVSVPDGVLALYTRVLREPENFDLVGELARSLADSGSCRPPDPFAADIASTGGPSSLSTLLCPLSLVDLGLTVPKIGVAGRPAGGIDVLGTIPGYRTHLNAGEFEETIRKVGYAHIVADANWAPADATLFRLRQQEGNQAKPSLVVASLLAKKLAAGVHIAGLDARVAKHGNFGSDVPSGRQSADLYCEVGLRLGLKPVVFLTDATIPYQPFIGRGEALTAVSLVISGELDDPWLEEHASMCQEMARILESHAPTRPADGTSGGTGTGLAAIMSANLVSQGASSKGMREKLSQVADQPRRPITANRAGYVHYDLQRIRDWMLSWAGGMPADAISSGNSLHYTDFGGVRLLSSPGRNVQCGETVVELRGRAAEEIASTPGLFTIEDFPSGHPNRILEVVAP